MEYLHHKYDERTFLVIWVRYGRVPGTTVFRWDGPTTIAQVSNTNTLTRYAVLIIARDYTTSRRERTLEKVNCVVVVGTNKGVADFLLSGKISRDAGLSGADGVATKRQILPGGKQIGTCVEIIKLR